MARIGWRPALLLFFLSMIPFLPVLNGEYLNWDDDTYFTENPDISSPQGWKRQLARFGSDAHVYPLVFASFRLENRLFGMNAKVSHAIGLVLHGLVSVSAFFLILRWVSDAKVAFWAVLLFAVHPLQVSTVAWVSERKSLLGSLFFFLALIAGTSRDRGRRWIWVSLPLATCAYLCKSPLVVFPFVLLLGETVSRCVRPAADRSRGVFWTVWFLHVAVAAGFAWIYSQREVSQSLSVRERLELIPRTAWHYFSSWAFPTRLSPVYPKWELGDGSWLVWGWSGLVLAVILVVAARKRIEPLEWFGAGFSVVTLLPAAGWVSFGYQKHAYVSDHFMYLPVLGLSIILGSWMTRISLGRKVFFPLLCVGLVFLWGLVSWQQSRIWRHPVSFWQAVIRTDEGSWVGHENLGTYLDSRDRIEEAFFHYRRAVEVDPEEPIGWINLGRNLIRQGKYPEAAHALARAIDLNVYYVEAHLFRAEAFLRMGEEQKAVDQFHSAIAVRSGNIEARLKIASLLLHARNEEVRSPKQALRWLRPFEKAPPSEASWVAWGLMAEAHARLGDFEQAIHWEKKRLAMLSDSDSEKARAIRRRIGFLERGFVP